MLKNKKGQVMNAFGGLAIGIATFTIVIVVAFLVMAQVKVQDEDVTGIVCNASAGTGSAGCNATITLQEATDTVPPWVPLIVIVVIGGTIIGMVKVFGR